MTTALVVSRHFPFNANLVHGLYQRLGVMVQALAKVVDRVECLLLVPRFERYDRLADHKERLRRLWSSAISIRVAPSTDEDVPNSLWQRVGQGIFDFHRQLVARPADTAEAISAVAGALDSRPDLVLAHRLSSMCVFMRLAKRCPDRRAGTPVYSCLAMLAPQRRSERLRNARRAAAMKGMQSLSSLRKSSIRALPASSMSDTFWVRMHAALQWLGRRA